MSRATHRVHRYARDVLSGRIVAGPLVRLACERHERDLKDGKTKGFSFEASAADHAIGFIEKWVRLPDTSDEHGDPKPFKLEPWQTFLIGSMFGWKLDSGYRRFRYAYIEVGKGNGKALALDTPIPTTGGWTTMGEVRVGDVLFDERGTPTTVLGAFDVMHDHPCYRVTFDDGSSIVADADHLWFTEQRCHGGGHAAVVRGVSKGEWGAWRKGIRTTRHIADTMRYKNGQYQSANHSIPLAGPLGTTPVPLPIDPYVLGVWLGDGDSDCARLTIADADAELLTHVAAAGGVMGARKQSIVAVRTPRYRVDQLQGALRSAGLLHNKHIPAAYLRASVGQRLALLNGLMDTDGSISKDSGQCEFATTRQALADGAYELIVSLGIKTTILETVATLNGRAVSPLWRLLFFPPHDLPVFRLSRKRQHQVQRHTRRRLAGDRRIVSCEPVPSVPVRCIAVDSPSKLFLAGRSMVPTHNTPLLAAVGLYGLLMDGQKAPEIYAAAADRDQAMIMYRDAVRMVDASPELAKRIHKSGIQHVHNMAYGLGFFRPFSREQSSKSGTRPHMGLIDEVHEHPNPEIVNKMHSGAKGNMDALFAEITNSGYDRTSICFQHHEHSRRVVEQAATDERWFAYVCALDEGDDPLEDSTCWIKANPNLGVSIGPEYLRDQVASAKNISASTNTNLRLNFCVWTHAQSRFIDMAKWGACRATVNAADMVGAKCFAGLDLGMTDDFSALAIIWLLKDGRVVVKSHCWIPEATLITKPNRPYAQWQQAGVLTVTPGEAVDYATVQTDVLEMCEEAGVEACSYDPQHAKQMAQNFEGAGLPVLKTRQGWDLTEPLKKLSTLIANQMLVHDDNPILNWMASNYVVRYGRDNLMRPDKDHAADKIDGMVALTMALDNLRQPLAPEPEFQILIMGAK